MKTGRKQGKDTFCFLELNDGSSQDNVQVMVTTEVYDISKIVATGTSIVVKGKVVATPEGAKQAIEVYVFIMLFSR